MEMLHMIEALANAKGSNAKLDVLRNLPEEHVGGLKKVVEYALDNMKKYHVSSIDDFTPTLFDEHIEEGSVSPPTLFTLLDLINFKGSANATDKAALARLKAGLDANDKKVADLIIGRDLRCGMGLSSFRKVWGEDFLPDMEYALMGSYNAKKVMEHIIFEEGAFSQLKSDGKRCILTKRGGNYETRSRNGKPNGDMPHIIAAAKLLFPEGDDGFDFDLDGELVVLDENGKILPRTTGNGIVAKVAAGSATKEQISRVRFVVWDLIIRTEFGLTETYGIRFGRLKQLLAQAVLDSGTIPIWATESKTVWSLKEAKEHYQEMVRRGEEGTILKNNGSVWTPGDSTSARCANGFKFKEEFEGDFEIVGWYYGKQGTKYEKAIGGYRCRSKCGMVMFNVGSGLKDSDRFIDNPDKLIGTIVEIRYNARVMAKDSDIWSLFLPRVIEHRNDKSVADDLNKLIEAEEASRALGV